MSQAVCRPFAKRGIYSSERNSKDVCESLQILITSSRAAQTWRTAPVSRQGTRVIRSAQLGMIVNALLALIKLVAGIVGNTYALVADAVESTADIFASLVVWGGLRVA